MRCCGRSTAPFFFTGSSALLIASTDPPQATAALSSKILDGLFRDRDAIDLLPRLLRAWEPGRFSAR
jgi:hypothetical protein